MTRRTTRRKSDDELVRNMDDGQGREKIKNIRTFVVSFSYISLISLGPVPISTPD
jgi:hypothetical protein